MISLQLTSILVFFTLETAFFCPMDKSRMVVNCHPSQKYLQRHQLTISEEMSSTLKQFYSFSHTVPRVVCNRVGIILTNLGAWTQMRCPDHKGEPTILVSAFKRSLDGLQEPHVFCWLNRASKQAGPVGSVKNIMWEL